MPGADDIAAREAAQRRWLGVAALVVLGLALAALLLSLSGVLAPRPAGPEAAAVSPGFRSVGAGAERVEWQALSLPERFTLRLEAAHSEGEIDSGYGVAVGSAERNLVAAVSPTGYAAIWEQTPDGPRYLLPWQTWAHVRMGDAANEIWLDMTPEGDGWRAIVRVNRELLWEGATGARPSQSAIWLGSFGGAATVDFRRLSLFAP